MCSREGNRFEQEIKGKMQRAVAVLGSIHVLSKSDKQWEVDHAEQ